MELTNISKSILLREAEEVAKIIHIINNTKETNQTQIYIAILPFISSLCDGILERLKTEGYSLENSEIEEIEFNKLVKNSRVAFKLYSDKNKNKIKKEIEQQALEWYSYLVKDYDLFQKLVIKIIGQQDLGVYYYDKIPYGNIYQLGIYFKNILKNKNTYNLYYKPEFLIEYVSEITRCIYNYLGETFNKYEDTSIDTKICKHFSEIDFYFIDQKRRNIFKGNLPDYLQILLFNVYCQNNTVEIVIKKIFNSNGIFYTRALIQTYIISVQALKKVAGALESNDNNLINEISEIVEYKENIFKNSQFRNNIFHYNLEGVPPEIFNDEERYFYEMIEAYSGKNINDFLNDIHEENNKINNIILKLVDFK